jgi:sugar O-acyltransferase (sialic acid O-acetyltransferase NeuD family)
VGEILLYAVGSALTAEFEETSNQADKTICAWIKNRPGDTYCADPSRLIEADELTEDHIRIPFLVPLFQPANRETAVNEALQKGLSPAGPLIDPRSILPSSLDVGDGTFINAAVTIGAQSRIGKYVIVNRSASIGHHAEIGDFVSFGPGALLAGQVRVGDHSLLGVGCVVLPKISIGSGVLVAAGAVVTKDVPDGAAAFGNPARIVKRSDVE